MRTRAHGCPRWICAALLLAALSPRVAHAEPDPSDLSSRADALDSDGRFEDAARLWEQLAAEASDERQRMHGYLHAFHAWMAAYKATDEVGSLRAARAILRQAVDDERIDVRARDEFQAELDKVAALGVDDRPRVALLDPQGNLPAPEQQRAAQPADRPRRSPLTIAGGTVLAVAAPALGGFIFAAAADRAIVREVNEERERVAAGGPIDGASAFVDERRPEAVLLRDLQIGLGLTTAVLVGTGVGLLVAGRRRARATPSVAVLPQAGRDLGGVTVTGRF